MDRAETVEVLILGAGPAGLAAGYRLSEAGVDTVILEKSEAPGGLMRSIRRGDFIVDIGRKELYSRIPVVDSFWTDLLGGDYRPYEHRIGILFDGHIVELSRAYRGFRRGVPWGLFLASIHRPRVVMGQAWRIKAAELRRVLVPNLWSSFQSHLRSGLLGEVSRNPVGRDAATPGRRRRICEEFPPHYRASLHPGIQRRTAHAHMATPCEGDWSNL